jgi:hypothetical protein
MLKWRRLQQRMKQVILKIEIVVTYPSLSLPAVFAALAYYHSHRTEIDAEIESDERFAAEMRAKAGPSILQKRRATLHGADHPIPPG